MAEDKELTPSWLTKDVLAETTSTKLKGQKVQVSSFEVRRAIPKGNNYVSDVLRVKVHFSVDDSKESQCSSFIIKVPKSGNMSGDEILTGFIKREEKMYNEVMPKLISAFGGDNVFAPNWYPSPVPRVLIFDDLNPLGYKMVDRRGLLNFEQSAETLKALARFHAASVRCHEEEPELIESLTETFITEEARQYRPEFVQSFFTNAADNFKNFPELERFSDKFGEYKDKAWDLLLDCLRIDSKNLNVLNHGDFWLTNVLFKYSDDDDKLIDAKLIDFQLSRYGTPAADLTYLLYASVHHDVAAAKFDDLLEVYLDELNRSLKLCGVERVLHIEELKSYMNKLRFFAIYTMFALLPMVLNDETEIFDFSEMKEDDFKGEKVFCFVNTYFKNKVYVENLARRLSDFEKQGWP